MTNGAESSPTFAEACKRHLWWNMALLALLCAAYAPVYPRMVRDWLGDPNYSHGLLVPLVSAWFLREIWPQLRAAPVRPSAWGFVLALAGLMLLAAGMFVGELFSSRVSSLVLAAGMILALFGGRVLRLLSLPLGFLIFMVPLPYTVYDALALPLKGLVSRMAAAGINLCGLPVLREGNMILFPNLSLEVVEACSGLRSLTSLVALGTAYAFLFLKAPWQRVVLIAATVPIAVFANVLRVFVTGLLARHMGARAAEGFFHNFAGLAVFGTALALTALLGFLLDKWSRKGGPRG